MISLFPADLAPDAAVLHSRGGFTWFYVDIVDGRGGGATVIWSWGLPFLPGYASAARRGRPQAPIERPSVNVVVYRNGRERFYLLSELPPDKCEWGGDGRSWRLGDSTFTWTDTPAGSGAPPMRELRAELDLALPTGGRATGRLRVGGPLRVDADSASVAAADDTTHQWSPMLAACHASLELSTPRGDLRVAGRGYHDRNSAERPLHALGIRSWWWGRLALPTRDLIVYRLIPSAPGSGPCDLVMEIAENGTCRSAESSGVRFGPMRRSAWGMRAPTSLTFPDPDGRTVHVEVTDVPDRGPFYQRYLLRGQCGTERGSGIGETLVPDRVDSDLLRPLVRMRVHRADGPNSMWLPLFSGDTAGRWARLVRRTPAG